MKNIPLIRNENEIRFSTGAGFLPIFKARKQAHSKLCNCLRNTEDGQKGKSVVEVISFTFLTALFLTACVTINIYFPAAAAEKVADEIIQEIQKDKTSEKQNDLAPQSGLYEWQVSFYRMLDQTISVVISPAHAEADLSVDTAEIRRIRASMQARFASLKGFYKQGLVGIKSDGMLTVRGNVPLKDRNKVNKLVAAENADRSKLYQAIANANGHPEWFAQIKATFAARWVGNAQSGWWYQSSSGSWNQK